MKNYKICNYCGEYESDCQCLAAREMGMLIASVRGILLGLSLHPSDVPQNGCLISEVSMNKIQAIGRILDQYDTPTFSTKAEKEKPSKTPNPLNPPFPDTGKEGAT